MDYRVPIRMTPNDWNWVKGKVAGTYYAQQIENQLFYPEPTLGDYIDAIHAHCGIKQISKPIFGQIDGSRTRWFIHGRDTYFYAITEDMRLYRNRTQNPETWQRISINNLPTDNTQEMDGIKDDLFTMTRGVPNDV